MKYLFLVVILFSLNSYSWTTDKCNEFQSSIMTIMKKISEDQTYSLQKFMNEPEMQMAFSKVKNKNNSKNISTEIYNIAYHMTEAVKEEHNRLSTVYVSTDEGKQLVKNDLHRFTIKLLNNSYSKCLSI